MNQITINGKTYNNISGNNISIINGNVIVDGKVVTEGLSGIVEVKFEGDLASLETDASASIKGDIHGDVVASGSVNCQNVRGDVRASGSISCGHVQGNVKASGSVSYKR